MNPESQRCQREVCKLEVITYFLIKGRSVNGLEEFFALGTNRV